LARGDTSSHPAGRGIGWWRRADRFEYGHRGGPRRRIGRHSEPHELTRPLVVIGARGTLGSALGTLAAARGLDAKLLTRYDIDIGDPEAVVAVLGRLQPWAVVNAAGYVNVRNAEADREACFRINADGPAILAAECGRIGAALVTFSTDLVFDGKSRRPYLEHDPVAPTTVYGASKVEAERRLAEVMPSALVIRTSAFFGPWDAYNLLTRALTELRQGGHYTVPSAVVSPTYVPDLANAALDLLIDSERGIWHVANPGEVTWLEFIRRGAELAGLDAGRLREASPNEEGRSPDLSYTALGSARGVLLPPLEDALARYMEHVGDQTARARLPDVLASGEGA
jgi:dTDP-4-dehydrorhamnose reductase